MLCCASIPALAEMVWKPMGIWSIGNSAKNAAAIEDSCYTVANYVYLRNAFLAPCHVSVAIS